MNRPQWCNAILAVSLFACGDSETDLPDACEPFSACGGDVVGTWRIEASCSLETEERAIDTLEEELPPECSGSLESVETEPVDASITFGADGSATVSGSTALRLEYTFGDACLASLYPGLGSPSAATCSQLGPDMAGAMAAGPLGTASCALEGASCACEFSFAPDVSASGSYTAADGRITIGEDSVEYCVSGDILRMGVPSLGMSVARRQ